MDQKFCKKIYSNGHEKTYYLQDHLNGFDKNCNNKILEIINNKSITDNKIKHIVDYNCPLLDKVKDKYHNLSFRFNLDSHEKIIGVFDNFTCETNNKKIKNFCCTFLGSVHTSRMFLSAILDKNNFWNDNYCTKNFTYSLDQLDAQLTSYLVEDNKEYYRNFFINQDSKLYQKIVNRNYQHCYHYSNLNILEEKYKNSFITIIGETIGTSYHPFVTEKFAESVVTKSLFLSYAQPQWHSMLKNYYGFKLYEKIFDYDFDRIQNPVYRLVKLIEIIGKFQHLSELDWHDLYLVEKDAIEYNCDHYYSKSYLKNLAKFF